MELPEISLVTGITGSSDPECIIIILIILAPIILIELAAFLAFMVISCVGTVKGDLGGHEQMNGTEPRSLIYILIHTIYVYVARLFRFPFLFFVLFWRYQKGYLSVLSF